jgi:hypothetical protein
MLTLGTARRVNALLLLVTLPAIVGARLTLDAHTALSTQSHIESEHNGGTRGHDHRLCVLLARNLWAPVPPGPVPAVPAPDSPVPIELEGDEEQPGTLQLRFARAPPCPD